jgi:predicted ester cyclase
MPVLRHEVKDVVVHRDVEMARVVVTGRLASSFGGIEGTGQSFRIDQAVITHLRKGKVFEAWEVADMASLSTGTRRLIRVRSWLDSRSRSERS